MRNSAFLRVAKWLALLTVALLGFYVLYPQQVNDAFINFKEKSKQESAQLQASRNDNAEGTRLQEQIRDLSAQALPRSSEVICTQDSDCIVVQGHCCASYAVAKATEEEFRKRLAGIRWPYKCKCIPRKSEANCIENKCENKTIR